MCLYSKYIKNPRYKKNQKNGGVIPPVSDERLLWIPTKCGNCIECRKQKAREWQVRLLEDIKTHKDGKYITLTFSNESIKELHEQYIQKTDINGRIVKVPIKELYGYEKDNAIATRSLRLFNERWRKKYKTAVRHWLVTELGHKGTEHLHMHGIIWTKEPYNIIRDIWKYGYIWPREESDYKKTYVNERTVNYIIKYVHKVDKDHPNYKSKIYTSSGIGNNYTLTNEGKCNKFNGKKTEETYRTSTGHKIKLPTYWRNKIYTAEEKEKLWLNKLDSNEMWVCGEKVNTKYGMTEYYKLIEYYKVLNKKLGYGTGDKNEEDEELENIMRNSKIAQRIRNAQ